MIIDVDIIPCLLLPTYVQKMINELMRKLVNMIL